MSENSGRLRRDVFMGGWHGTPTPGHQLLAAPWIERGYTRDEVDEIARLAREEVRDAIADAVAESLGGEYDDFAWIRDLPVKAAP